MTTAVGTHAATTFSRMNFSGYVGQVIFDYIQLNVVAALVWRYINQFIIIIIIIISQCLVV